MLVNIIKRHDSELTKCAECTAVRAGTMLSKKVEETGNFSKENYRKTITFLRKHLSREVWDSLPYSEKCWVGLLLIGRAPFILGRKSWRLALRLYYRG